MSDTLFGVDAEMVALTTDDWYTPRWIFTAAALTFDMDVAAPMDPAHRTVPARRYLTAQDDGLTHPWEGLVWCNPPYSDTGPWAERFAAHPDGLMLVLGVPRKWTGPFIASAHAFTVLTMVDFHRPDGSIARLQWPNFLAARGPRCTEALIRVAKADQYARGTYLVAPGGAA